MGWKVHHRPIAIAGLLLAALATPAQPQGLERAYDFESLKQQFERQDAQQRDDGLVLQRLRDQKGIARGRLSLGGDASHPDPFEGTAGAVNFRGRSDDELGGSIINLRVSF